MTTNMKTAWKHHDVLTLRRQRQLNQQDFWSRIGVTQSGGSRYETGRGMPKAVRHLVYLTYVLDLDLEKINEQNAPVIRSLLAGELDKGSLMETAEQARKLLAQVEQLGGSANALSAEAVALASKVAAHTHSEQVAQ